MKSGILKAAALATFAVAAPAQAVVIGFEDVDTPGSNERERGQLFQPGHREQLPGL